MGLFRFMKRVAQVYSQRHNRKNLRCGPVWEGRFKSTAIEDEAYLMRCYRYIELNPVRAGIVSAPERYRWSSFGYNAEPSTSWIVPHPLYLGLGNNPTERAARYRRFVEEGMTAEELQAIRFATRSSLPLGSRELRRRLAMQVRGTSPGTSPG